MECDGERSQEGQQQEGTVQCRMIERDDGELVQEKKAFSGNYRSSRDQEDEDRLDQHKVFSFIMSWEFIAR